MRESNSEAGPDSSTPAASLMELRGVGKIYHMGELDVPVLHDVDLDIHASELLVIVGPSGSGKSTLLNLIGGIDRPTSGTIHFEGRNVTALSDSALTVYRRKSIGFVFQFYNLVPTLTALENVLVSTEIAEDPLDAAECLEMVGLEHRIDHFPSQLSGGEQQRVAIARAVAKNPKMLLCDEPTGALDLATGRHVLEVLGNLNRELGKSVVIITHNSAIADVAHRVIRLGQGSIAELYENENPLPATEVTW